MKITVRSLKRLIREAAGGVTQAPSSNMRSLELDVVDDVKESMELARDAGCTATRGGEGSGGQPTIIVTGSKDALRAYLMVYTGGDKEETEYLLSASDV